MNTLSLVESIELDFQGNVLKNAIYVGDVDNDGLCELCIGNSEGELAIFRNNVCIGGANDLGTISACTVGDLLNIGRNVLVVVSVEGWCHIFDIEREFQTNQRVEYKPDIPSMFQINPADKRLDLVPFHSQRIPPNSKCVELADVNGDGLIEMVVGLTDRVLRSYQWRLDDDKPKIDSPEDDNISNDGNDVYDGRLYGMNKWEFANQIGGIAIQKNSDLISILVSQPGGTTTQITQLPEKYTGKPFPFVSSSSNQVGAITLSTNTDNDEDDDETTGNSQFSKSPSENILIQYHTLDIDKMENRSITTEVSGNILFNDTNDHYGLATIDGTIIIAKGNDVKWSLDVDQQILSLRQVNGKLLVCACDGDTYLIEINIGQDKEMPIRFNFEESVAAFAAGSYAIRDQNIEENSKETNDEDSKSLLINKNCMIYVTFQEKIYIYTNELL